MTSLSPLSPLPEPPRHGGSRTAFLDCGLRPLKTFRFFFEKKQRNKTRNVHCCQEDLAEVELHKLCREFIVSIKPFKLPTLWLWCQRTFTSKLLSGIALPQSVKIFQINKNYECFVARSMVSSLLLLLFHLIFFVSLSVFVFLFSVFMIEEFVFWVCAHWWTSTTGHLAFKSSLHKSYHRLLCCSKACKERTKVGTGLIF